MDYQKLAIGFFLLGLLLVIVGLVWAKSALFINRVNGTKVRKAQKDAADRSERQVIFQLQYLDPKEYTTWHNTYMEKDGIKHEFDHIVFGPSGIVHIETKNYGGELKFTINGIEQTKRSSQGFILSEKNIKNPSGQLLRHEYLLKKILSESSELDVPVNGVLCIANERATIQGKPDGFHICKDNVLVSYIQQLPRYDKYNDQWRVSILKLFEQYIVAKEAVS